MRVKEDGVGADETSFTTYFPKLTVLPSVLLEETVMGSKSLKRSRNKTVGKACRKN